MYNQNVNIKNSELTEFKKSFMCLVYFIYKKENKEMVLDKENIFYDFDFDLHDFENLLKSNENIEDFVKCFFKKVSNSHKKMLLFLFLISNNEYDFFDFISRERLLQSRYSKLLNDNNILNENMIYFISKYLSLLKVNKTGDIPTLLNIELSIKNIKTLKSIEFVAKRSNFENQYILESQWLNDFDKSVLKDQWRACLKETITNFKYTFISVFFMNYSLDRFNRTLNYFFTKEEIKEMLNIYKKKLNIPYNISNESSVSFKNGLKKVDLFFKSNEVSLFDEADIKKLNKRCSKIFILNEKLSSGGIYRVEFNLNLMRNLKEIDMVNGNIFKDNASIFKNYSEDVLNSSLNVISKMNLSDIEISQGFNKRHESKVNIINTSKEILFFIEDEITIKDMEDIQSFILNFTFNFVSHLSNIMLPKYEYENFQRKQELKKMQEDLNKVKLNKSTVRKF